MFGDGKMGDMPLPLLPLNGALSENEPAKLDGVFRLLDTVRGYDLPWEFPGSARCRSGGGAIIARVVMGRTGNGYGIEVSGINLSCASSRHGVVFCTMDEGIGTAY